MSLYLPEVTQLVLAPGGVILGSSLPPFLFLFFPSPSFIYGTGDEIQGLSHTGRVLLPLSPTRCADTENTLTAGGSRFSSGTPAQSQTSGVTNVTTVRTTETDSSDALAMSHGHPGHLATLLVRQVPPSNSFGRKGNRGTGAMQLAHSEWSSTRRLEVPRPFAN